jgi:hypothetical protein
MAPDARPWTHAALYGALWGCLELSLGTALQLGRVPMKGLLMGSLGLICLVTLRRLQPRPGVCLIAGAVAIFLKVFAMGGLYPGPVIGIAGEAVIVEIAFTATLSRGLGAVVGGALALAINPLQMVLMTWFVAGPEAVRAAVAAVQAAAGRAGVPAVGGATILAVLAAGSAAVGGVVGAVSWLLAGRVARRLGREA